MSVRHAYTIKDTHSRNITAIGFNPARREVVLGFEDGTLKVWEADPCKFVQHLSPGHQGWVTSIVYWPEIKTFITAGQDGVIMFWSGNSLVDIVHTEEAIYSMAVNIRKSQLVCGTSTGINLYELDKYKLRRHYIDPHDFIKATEHTDIVKCLAYFDSRVFSGGFDQRLIIYESGYHGVREMTPISVRRAHEAGLNNLIVAQDAEHNSWLITSAFDKCVKVWTTDGKLVHRLDDFASPVTGICFIARNKTIWVAAGYHFAFIYEPKSGENVSEFCDTFLAKEDDEVETARNGCVTTFFTETPIDCLTYTNKAPILIFSTDQQGDIVKWERKQTNAFAFSKESLRASESMEKMLQKKIARRRMAQLKKSPQQLLQEQKREGKRAKKDGQVSQTESLVKGN
uniref:WD_REPEATS_REGION domain-containing protein n=1 Tax=Macrostomum lignano TaxID=282301 RepID=A0A1I8HC49_9PLAT